MEERRCLLNHVGIHIWTVTLPSVPAGLLHVLVWLVEYIIIFDPLYVKFGLLRSGRQEYEGGI